MINYNKNMYSATPNEPHGSELVIQIRRNQ